MRTLRDKQQFCDKNNIAQTLGISTANWPIFGVLWPSCFELATHMVNSDVSNKRILEVGCGIGLTSLLLNHMHADISATDNHPNVLEFLHFNALLNNDRIIPFKRMDWKELNNKLGKFDLIIGSDLLYEASHAKMLSKFIDHHANDRCEVVIVDPKRGQHAKFIKMMSLLGYSQKQHNLDDIAPYDNLFKHIVINLIK